MPLRPPAAEHRLDLGRRRPPGCHASAAAGSASIAATARSSASFSGRHRHRVREHGRADLRLPVDDETREMAGHGAAVADEDMVAGAVELEARSPRRASSASWSTIARTCAISSSVDAFSTRSSPAARNAPQRARSPVVDQSLPSAPAPPRSSSRLQPDAHPSTARRSSRGRPGRQPRVSSASGRADRGFVPAAPSPTSRRAPWRRPRRAARTRGSSSATRNRVAAPVRRRRCRRAAPRGYGAFIVSQISPGGSR